MLLSETACLIGSNLRGKRGALSRTLEVYVSGAGPGDRIPRGIRDGNEGVVKRRTNVGDANRNILPLLLFSFLNCFTCHFLLVSGWRLAVSGSEEHYC